MATKKYDLAVKIGSYTDASGQQKNRYQNIGAVLEGQDGRPFMMIERWFSPSGVPHDPSRGNSILISMFEPRRDAPQSSPADDGDVPF